MNSNRDSRAFAWIFMVVVGVLVVGFASVPGMNGNMAIMPIVILAGGVLSVILWLLYLFVMKYS